MSQNTPQKDRFRPVSEMSREQIEDELMAWRRDAVARLLAGTCAVRAAWKKGSDEWASHNVRMLGPAIAMIESALSADFWPVCEATGEPIKPGDRYYHYADGVLVKIRPGEDIETGPDAPPVSIADEIADELPERLAEARALMVRICNSPAPEASSALSPARGDA